MKEKYEFYLKGYIHLKNVIPKDLIAKARDISNELKLRKAQELPKHCIPHLYGGGNFYQLHNMLEYDDVFLEVMAHDEIIPYIYAMVPRPCRLIESILLYRKKGFGNPLHRNTFSNMRMVDGRIQADYVATLVYLTDMGPDDGPTIIIEGSHHIKNKFPFHPIDPRWNLDHLTAKEKFENNFDGLLQIPFNEIPGYREVHCEAGDVIIFSEDVIHGAKEVSSDKERLVLKYGYAPYYVSNLHGVEYSKDLINRCNEVQRNFLTGPYYGYIFENSSLPHMMERSLFTNLFSSDAEKSL
jgi:hypothetical protein